MATTKFYLDCRGKAKDGKGSVLITIYHNASTTTVSTGIRVSPNNWSKDKVTKISGSEAINASLQEQKLKIDKAIALLSLDSRFNIMSAADIKKEIVQEKAKRHTGHLVYDLFQEYMNTGNLKEGTKKIYMQTLQKVISFGGRDMKIESLNLKWLREFDMFLSQSQGTNGKAIYLRDLRTVCNYARHIGIECHYPFDNFHIRQEETQKRCIPVRLFREFLDYPTSERNSYYRDYFLLMFYLIGINSADLLLAKKSQIVNGRLEYYREKTGKKYSIKLEPEAKELLNRYRSKSDYLLEAMDHCKHYVSFAREINDSLKLIGPEIDEEVYQDDLFGEPIIKRVIQPIIPEITTYYARHSWATFAHEIGVSSDVISLALGHSPTNRTTFIYIKPDQSKVDEANRKVIDYITQHG